MKVLAYIMFLAVALSPLLIFAQDISTLEEVQHGQYIALQTRIDYVQNRLGELQSIKTQVDDIITQVRDRPVTGYREDAEKYQELEVLVPAAARYAQEMVGRQRQLDELLQQKSALQSQVLDRRGSLPTWWVQ